MSHNRKSWVTKMYLEGNYYPNVRIRHNKGNTHNDTIIGMAEYHDMTGEYDSDIFIYDEDELGEFNHLRTDARIKSNLKFRNVQEVLNCRNSAYEYLV